MRLRPRASPFRPIDLLFCVRLALLIALSSQLKATMNALRLSTRLAPRAFGLARSVKPNPTFTSFRAFAGGNPNVPVASGVPDLDQLGSVDTGFYDDRIDKVREPERRAFAYLMLTTVRFAYASAARLLVVKCVASLSISASAAALATADFDLSAVEFGETITVKWRGKPIFIRRRKPHEIEEVRAVPMSHLRDQETDDERVINPEWIVVVAICPHLGCVPVSNAGEYHGWFCPCHGSHYDVSGRIRKGPSPLNLEVPPYQFMDEKNLLIG